MNFLIRSLKKLFYDLILLPILRLIDYLIPKKRNYWGFSVHHIKSDQFIENSRAVFEFVKTDDLIKKIIFTRNNTIDFNIENAVNTSIIKLMSFRGLWFIFKCKVLFVTHSIAMDYSFRYCKSDFSVLKLNLNKRIIVNLWHGIPLKKLYALWNPLVQDRLDRVKFRKTERKYYSGLISSSQIDSYAMATMFYPIKYESIWITGLPRNDFLLININKLPKYLYNMIEIIKNLKNGKKLITYAPTYRQTSAVTDSVYYQFSFDEINKLKKLLLKHNAIFGFRMHYFRNNQNLFNFEKFIDNELIFDLGHEVIAEIAPVIRESDLIISDYSSVFIEGLYLNKPIIGFTYDFEHYRDNQDGILYDFGIVFPGTISIDFSSLLENIDSELTLNNQVNSEKYKLSKKFFFEFIDTNNSERVVNKVKEKIKNT